MRGTLAPMLDALAPMLDRLLAIAQDDRRRPWCVQVTGGLMVGGVVLVLLGIVVGQLHP